MAVNILLKRSGTSSKRPNGVNMAFGELNLNYDSATGGLFYKDNLGNTVKVGPCQISATAPNSTPAGALGNSAGEFWYDNVNSVLYVFDGTDWKETGGAVQGVTGVAPIVVDNTDPLNPEISIDYATDSADGSVQLATDAEVQAGVEATHAVTPAGLQSKVSDSTSTTSSTTLASSTAVKSAYDLADAALARSGGTMTGDITFAPGQGIVFSDSSEVSSISDSTSVISSVTAASSTAVKDAYDLADAALARSGGTMTGTITFAVGQLFPVDGIQDATGAQKGVVQIGSNIEVASGVISILDATTAQKGVVQLEDSTSSTSTTLALTANQGKLLQDQINALIVSSNLTYAGTIDASTGLVSSVSTEGDDAGFTVGQALPAAAAGNAEYFVIVDVPGTFTPPGGSSTAANDGDWLISDGATTYTYIPAGWTPIYASETEAGLVELATDAEVQAGTETTLAVTPAGLQSKVSDSVSTTSSTTIASSTAVKDAYDLADTIYNGTFAATARPTAALLQTPTIVATVDQLGVVIDSSTGAFHSVEFFDAGLF